MSYNDTKETLLEEARKYLECGRKVVTINGKKPTLDEWTPLRDMNISIEQVRDWLSSPLVERIAILLDKSLLAFDYDGAGEYVIWDKLIPRCSLGLHNAFHQTTLTKTPHGGHTLFGIDAKDFPEGIKEVQCWWNGKEHNQVILLSQNKYLVERGAGYQAIRGIDSLVRLSKGQVSELISLLQLIRLETIAIKHSVDALLPYYYTTNRDSLTFGLSGFLHKGELEEYLIKDVQEYLMDVSGTDTPQERQERFSVIKNTCAKDRDTAGVSGREKLLEAINNNENVLITIQRAFKPLGYFKGSNSTTTRDNSNNENGVKLSAEVLKLLEPLIELLFRNQFDSAFAAIQINGHRETVPIHKSKRFDLWVRKTYYDETGNTLGSDILKEVVDTLEAKALFDGPIRTLELRISKDPYDDLVYWYDLCNENWEAIKITKDGWSIVKSNEVPIIFRRYSGQQAQAYPSKSYTSDIMDRFISLLNLKDIKHTKLLVKCYIIAVLVPEIAKARLMVHGPKGAAKTAFEDLLKLLLDPSSLTSLTLPRTSETLVQQLMHNFLVYYDNVSTLPEWLSNDLCRAVTGTASSKRELYTDDDDVIYQYMRPIGFNGINLAATRSDALDRGLIIEIERIKDEKRRSLKDDILPGFERLKPPLLGFIFDTIVKVLQLKARGGIELKSMSRMADYEIACEMISRCLGYKDGSFIEAYKENKELATTQVLEGSSVARAIIFLMESRDTWSGSATNLLSDLEDVALKLRINTQRDKSWPKAANALSRKLPYIKDNLEEVGISMHTTEDTKTKLKTIVLCKISPESSESSDKSKSSTDSAGSSDDINESHLKISPGISPDQTTENRAQNQHSDDSGGSDDILQQTKEEEKKEQPIARSYSDYLVDEVPIWQIEKRGWTHEEAEVFKRDVSRKSKVADMAAANESGNGVMGGTNPKNE